MVYNIVIEAEGKVIGTPSTGFEQCGAPVNLHASAGVPAAIHIIVAIQWRCLIR